MRIGSIVRLLSGARRLHALQEQSPLRRVDPRVKVLLSLLLSLAIMLPLSRLLVALALYAVLLAWGGLLPIAGRLLWRLKWAFLILFVVDWLLVSLHLAILVSLRIVLLSGSFALLFATTTPEEFRLALQWAAAPSLCLQPGRHGAEPRADRGEWRSLIEAQQARGVDAAHWLAPPGPDGARSGGPGRARGGDDGTPGVEHHRGRVRAGSTRRPGNLTGACA